jgi:hypothetical protein
VDLPDHSLITILEKGLLLIVGAMLGFFFNWLIQKKKTKDQQRLQDQRLIDELQLQKQTARDEFVTAISESRVEAYVELWKFTERVKYATKEVIPKDRRKELFHHLVKWYYEDAGAMFLSFNATARFNEARQKLCNSSSSDEEVREAFSSLRTELKFDCGIYSLDEKDKQLQKVVCDDEWYVSNNSDS